MAGGNIVITTYDIDGEKWEWDSWKGKWNKLRIEKFKPKVKEKQNANLSELDPKTHFEFIFKIYINCRLFPGWNTIKSLHNAEDNAYFDTLENYFKQGKIKPVEK